MLLFSGLIGINADIQGAYFITYVEMPSCAHAYI